MQSEQLLLRPLTVDDFDAMYKVASDPLIWEQHPNSDRYKRDVFEKFFSDALASGGAFIAIDRKNDQVIGSSRFFGLDEKNSEIEIGWTFLSRSHWGGPTNAEMKRLMLEHAFKYVKNVVFMIGPSNLRSRKAVEKIGAVHIGSRMRGGVESVVYRINQLPVSCKV
ncbi:MAG: GNAT family N-acetyltransferase [Candidatus Obscuribacterales bacterium]|nr:GNAT family N-acetyltransferase [Candidatus Obscuribacterales bacterium]